MPRISVSRSLVHRILLRMSSTKSSYEDAIRKLNSLQSNRSTIEQIKKSIKNGQKCNNIEDMENYLSRTGVPLAKLDTLSVIHVAGTKGKGSTSAMCESILRQHGFRTGFYSSPHLLAARERVRLGGRPLTEQAFARHFHRVYEMLYDTQEYEGDMPKYFAFLTVMAYNVFLMEEVDVAVVEVGIGGIVDYTNVLRKVPVVGITALGLDHTSILGHTLPEIAAAKAGVMKPGCAAYTVRQPTEAMDVLVRTADKVKCPLTVAPNFDSYSYLGPQKPHLQVNLEAYKTNASLAIQLAHAWLRITQGKLRQNGFRQDAINGHNEVINGHNEVINGHNDVINGHNGVINGHNDVINGHNDVINGHNDVINGHNDVINGHNGVINGHNDVINGHSDVMTGHNGVINGHNDVTNGLNDVINGHNGVINGHNDVINGHNDVINGHNGVINGHNDVINAQNDVTNGHNDVINGHNGVINGHNDVINGHNDVINGHNDVINGHNDVINGHKSLRTEKLGTVQYEVPVETAEGLRLCKWPGRYQVVESEHATFYLDGAHTKESMEICVEWFNDSNARLDNKILIFTATGDRNAETLLKPLTSIPFTHVYFVVPTTHRALSTNNDNYSLVEHEEQLQRCRNHAQTWSKHSSSGSSVLECVSDALASVNSEGVKPLVLITGSLHLVGAALSILDPDLSM